MIALLSALALAVAYPKYTYTDLNISSRGFVAKSLTPEHILTEFVKVARYSKPMFVEASPKRQVLAFLTPWNPQGYSLSLEFGNKLSIVVPVWFTLHMNPKRGFSIEGESGINKTWLEQMGKLHPDVLISPRILIDLPFQYFQDNINSICSELKSYFRKIAADYGIHSCFVEFGQILPDSRTQPIIRSIIRELKSISVHSHKFIIISNIPCPYKLSSQFESNQAVSSIADLSDYIYLGAYEVPQVSTLSPIAVLRDTLAWISSYSKKAASKAIIGIPFFGFDYSGGKREYVFGQDFLNIVKDNAVIIKWLPNTEEHAVFYTSKSVSHTMHYPTPLFLSRRFDEIMKSDLAGIGIWEITHGLPSFFDLL